MSGKKGKSGRPLGSVTREKSVVLRVPVSLVSKVESLKMSHARKVKEKALASQQLLLPLKEKEKENDLPPTGKPKPSGKL